MTALLSSFSRSRKPCSTARGRGRYSILRSPSQSATATENDVVIAVERQDKTGFSSRMPVHRRSSSVQDSSGIFPYTVKSVKTLNVRMYSFRAADLCRRALRTAVEPFGAGRGQLFCSASTFRDRATVKSYLRWAASTRFRQHSLSCRNGYGFKTKDWLFWHMTIHL